MSARAVPLRGTPYLLAAPAIALFVAVMIVPLIMTVLLSFYDWGQYKGIVAEFTLKNWREMVADDYYFGVYFRTLRISVIVTLLTMLIGVPEAYILNRMSPRWRPVCLLIVLGPLLISVVARTLGWALLLGSTGFINRGLAAIGLIKEPIGFMFSETGVVIALTHVLAPFMLLAVWAALQRLDPQVEQAAFSLGASQLGVMRHVVLPQIIPGIFSGGVIVFSLAASAFATPAIIGGRRLKVASTLAYDEFLNTLNWPLGAAVAVVLLAALVAIIVSCNRLIERRYAQVFE